MIPRLCVIGGGIAGLAAAHRAQELARERREKLQIVLLEAGPRVGGVLRTVRKNGYLLEEGPDSFLTEKPAARNLAVRLGLEKRLLGTNRENARSWVDRAGRLHPTPEAFFLLAPGSIGGLARTSLLSWPGKLRAAADLALPRRHAKGDESIAGFVRRRFGRELYERLAQPMIASVYGADADDLSLDALLPRFAKLEAEHRSVIWGLLRRRRAAEAAASGPRYSLFESFQNGMEELPRAIESSLPRGTCRARVSVRAVRAVSRSGRRVAVETARHGVVEAEAVVVALPAHAAATVLHPFDVQLASELAEIPYHSAVVVNLGYRIADVPHPMDGFGFVVPRAEHRAILAGSFSHVKFTGRAPSGRALIRAFLREGAGDNVFQRGEEAALEAVRRDLKDLLGITASPELSSVRLHPKAMPVYRVGHLGRVARIDELAERRPGLALAGNAYRGVGIPDCVASGEAAAERAVASI